MSDLESNLMKILALAIKLQDHYRISFEDHQTSLENIIRWAKECLEKLKVDNGGKKNA